MKTFFKILLLAVLFTSCEDVEPTIFNGNDTSNHTLLAFSRTAYALPVERDQTGTATVILNASTISTVDRTYGIELVLTEGDNAANPATYSVPTSITIPANSYQGTIIIDGVDGGLVDNVRKTFSIKLVDSSITTEYMDSNLAVVSVYEVCALQDDFTGVYMLEQVSAVSELTGRPAFKQGPVTLKIGDTPYDRVFKSEPYAGGGYGIPETDVVISFACDFLNLGNTITTGLACSSGKDIQFQQTENPSAYDTTNDDVFELTFVENAERACGRTPVETTVRFTKQQ